MMKFLILSLFSFAALAEIPNLDPNKFTICAMTINSDNERAVFEKEIKKNPTKFNPMVELTEFDSYQWFEKACESKIKCDQLIISGHFGGTFFGSSGKTLPLSELENKGCSKTCEGILSHPYEVFLMGCNTLATKEKDHRTPAQYLQVLLQDGIPQREAEMVVESRYGATGDDNKSKMQRAFSGEKKQLYGFHSVGPSGKSIEQFLKNYFNKSPLVSRLEKLQAQRMMDKVSFANDELKDALKHTAFAQCETGASGQDDKTRIICGLRDDKKSLEEKLLLMREAFSSENYLTFIPSVNEFLKRYPVKKMSSEHQTMIAEIGKNEVIKAQMINLLDKTDSLSLLMEWSVLAESLGFIQNSNGRIGRVLRKTIKKGVSLEEKDLICSQDRKLLDEIDLKVDDLPKTMDSEDYAVLGCIRPQDKEVHLKLADGLKDGNSGVRYLAKWALGQIKPQDKEVYFKIADALKDENSRVRSWTAEVLGEIKPQDKEVHLKLADALKDENPGVRNQVVWALGEMKPQDKEVHLKIADVLKDETIWVRTQAAESLGQIRPQDKEIHLKLADAFKDENWSMRFRVIKALGQIKPQDKEVRFKMVDALNDVDYEVRGSARESLSAIRPLDKEIYLKIIDILEEEGSRAYSEVFSVLKESGSQDKEVHLRLVSMLKDKRDYVAGNVIDILRNVKPQDKEIHLKIADAIAGKNIYVAENAIYALRDVNSQDKEVHLKVVDGLQNEAYQVREAAFMFFREVNSGNKEVHLKFAELLKDQRYYVRERAVVVLKKMKPTDREVLDKIKRADPDLYEILSEQ